MAIITITVPNGPALRASVAVGKLLGLGRNATSDEVGRWLWTIGKAHVLNLETNEAQAAVVLPSELADAG